MPNMAFCDNLAQMLNYTINPEIHRVLVDDARLQYAALFKEITRTEEPLVFHCSHGVHRTGHINVHHSP